MNRTVDFDLFRPDLERAVPRSNGTKGGHPPFDHVLMLTVLILQAMNGLGVAAGQDERGADASVGADGPEM